MNWVSIAEPTTPIRAQVQVRYRSPAVPVNVIPLENEQVKLVFDEPRGNRSRWGDYLRSNPIGRATNSQNNLIMVRGSFCQLGTLPGRLS